MLKPAFFIGLVTSVQFLAATLGLHLRSCAALCRCYQACSSRWDSCIACSICFPVSCVLRVQQLAVHRSNVYQPCMICRSCMTSCMLGIAMFKHDSHSAVPQEWQAGAISAPQFQPQQRHLGCAWRQCGTWETSTWRPLPNEKLWRRWAHALTSPMPASCCSSECTPQACCSC